MSKKLTAAIGLWLIAVFGTLAHAAVVEEQTTGTILRDLLRPGHPETYVVQRRDTLWDISSRFLVEPWFWPELWRVNPEIANPHLIYPGDILHLIWVDGVPQLTLERGLARRTVRLGPDGALSLQPRIRETAILSAIPAIGLDAIRAFLVRNRVVDRGVLEEAAYVIQGESRRIILGAGDRFYVRGAVPAERTLAIVRRGATYEDPDTRELLGIEAIDIGIARIVAMGRDVVTLEATSSRQDIRIGDRLMATEERRVDSTFFPSAPKTEVNGQIISVFDGVKVVGDHDVVVLNRGERESIEEGHVLAIYRRGDFAHDRETNEVVRLPAERAGILMVFRSFRKVSYALVLQTDIPLFVGDEVRNP
ncbi:MAG: LysM domain-containing protein [Pseudomonadales bacterium]